MYALEKPVRGIFLLLSNEFFKEARSNDVNLDDRHGTAKDCMAFDNLFKQLGFSVVIKTNLGADVRGFAVIW